MSCSAGRHSPTRQVVSINSELPPLVCISEVEDLIQTDLSAKACTTLTEALVERLQKKNKIPFSIESDKEPYKIIVQLVQHHEMGVSPAELTISVHLKILDISKENPEVLLQEVLKHTTLLKEPLSTGQILSWKEESFRVCPLGLAYAKLSREIAARLEDYILLATKG